MAQDQYGNSMEDNPVDGGGSSFLNTAASTLGTAAKYGSMFNPALALLGLPDAILGGFQAYNAHQGLEQLQKKPKPNYTISPELQTAYNRAQQMSNRGFTGGEKADFDSNLAMENAAQTRNLENQAGGSLAGSIFAGIQGRNIGALNKFASEDAGLQRHNIQYADSLGQAVQGQRNMATNVDIQRRTQQEQALGGAMAKGTENLVGGINKGLSYMAPWINGLGKNNDGQSPAPAMTYDAASNRQIAANQTQSQLSTDELDAITPEQYSQMQGALNDYQKQYLNKKFSLQNRGTA